MSISKVTSPEAVLSAIAECLAGEEAFLQKYDRGQPEAYFLKHGEALLPMKGVFAGAYFQQYGTKIGDFTSGARVARRLMELGFEVIVVRNGSQIPYKKDRGIGSLNECPFEIGSEYNRQADIHDRFGGQERGGIATPLNCPFIFLFTGENGQQFGYRDGWMEDGETFLYTGEGKKGDMLFKSGNRAVRDHVLNRKELLLFEALGHGKPYRFMGGFVCASWDYQRGLGADGLDRSVIQFQLVAEQVSEPSDEGNFEEDLRPLETDIHKLREAAYGAIQAARCPSPSTAKKIYSQRSAAVRDYVLARANGRCELTGECAPFNRKDGRPYLEVHHTLRVADGGPDHPSAVAAISPTIHREIHHGEHGAKLNEQLKTIVRNLELNG